MLLLIDGYNLLHQSDLMGRGRGDGWLQRARERLLRQLRRQLDDALAAETCVVFDAESPPPDRAHEYVQFDIRVLYAVGYPEADDLLEELIARHASPQRLTLVSSDHRLQRAAHRRRAHAFDADRWYAELLERGPRLGIRWPPETPPPDGGIPLAVPEKRDGLEDQREIEAWMQWFERSETARGPFPHERKPKTRPMPESPRKPEEDAAQRPQKPKKRRARHSDPAATKKRIKPVRKRAKPHDQRFGSPDKQLDPSLDNPFPEGYGEDILEDDL